MFSARLLRYSRATLARSYSTGAPLPTPPPVPKSIPVDELCIPLSPPYSIASYLPPPTPLSREVLIKLHKLSALELPTTEEGWAELEQLGDLAAIIEGIRRVDTSALGDEMIDARVRGQAVELEAGVGSVVEESDGFGRELLKLAEVTDGAYYTVPTPQNIKGKRRSSAGTIAEE